MTDAELAKSLPVTGCPHRDQPEGVSYRCVDCVTTALAAARAEGRREGLEEAARYLWETAEVVTIGSGYMLTDDGAGTLSAARRGIEALAAASSPRETPTEPEGTKGKQP